MGLDRIKTNQAYKIASIDKNCGEDILNNFYKLGFFPGVRVEVLHKRKIHMQVRVGLGSLYLLRNWEAKFVDLV
jgi:Fe2+ transport system protein FeoA